MIYVLLCFRGAYRYSYWAICNGRPARGRDNNKKNGHRQLVCQTQTQSGGGAPIIKRGAIGTGKNSGGRTTGGGGHGNGKSGGVVPGQS